MIKKKKSQLLSNIFSGWAAFLLNIIISFFLAPFVVKKLGNTYYGVWVIMMQFTGYLYLMDLGVRESIIRYMSKYVAEAGPEEEKTDISRVVNSAVILYSLVGLLCLAISILLSYCLSSIFMIPEEAIADATTVVLITGISLTQFFVFNAYSGIMMGLQRYDLMNRIVLVFSLVRPVVIVVVLSMGYGIVALAVIQLVNGIATNLVIYHSSRKLMLDRNIPYRLEFVGYAKNKQTYSDIYNYSKHVLVNNIGQKIVFHTDAVIIGMFMSAASVTFYAIGATLVDYLVKLCAVGVQVINPMVSELETRKDKESIRMMLQTACKLSLLVGMPIIVVYMTLGANFIRLWMGEEYMNLSGNVLILLSAMQLYSLPHHTISTTLYGMSQHHIIARLRIFEGALNIVLSVILVKFYGLYGVIVGTMIPHFLVMFILLPASIRGIIGLELREFYRKCYLKPLCAGIPFYATCHLIGVYCEINSLFMFFGTVLLIMPVYLISAWLIGFSDNERKRYKSAVLDHFAGA